jgi:hypothetical protein
MRISGSVSTSRSSNGTYRTDSDVRTEHNDVSEYVRAAGDQAAAHMISGVAEAHSRALAIETASRQGNGAYTESERREQRR